MKLLLVDDEPDILEIAEMSLEGEGFEVTSSNSAADGIARATRDRPDAIVMDMMMPGMDGKQALAALRDTPMLQDIPVIFMTAKVHRNDIAHYISLGAVGVIQKPFDPMALPETIRRILAGRGSGL